MFFDDLKRGDVVKARLSEYKFQNDKLNAIIVNEAESIYFLSNLEGKGIFIQLQKESFGVIDIIFVNWLLAEII